MSVAQNNVYVHSSPPKAISGSGAAIRQWVRSGDIEKLESLVLEGQGARLLGLVESAPDSKVKAFLRSIPGYMAKVDLIHDAVIRGSLRETQTLMDKKKLATARDAVGRGVGHKAVIYNNKSILEWLAKRYPEILNLKDNEGRTSLHYVAASRDPEEMYDLLVSLGSNPDIIDMHGRKGKYYISHPEELDIEGPTTRSLSRGKRRRISPISQPKRKLMVSPPSITRAQIRICIHEKDILKLEKIVWSGHGDKLLLETTNNGKVRRFLENVPHLLSRIKSIHGTAINNDLEGLKDMRTKTELNEIFKAKDLHGLTPLHKAAGIGNRGIIEYLMYEIPDAINEVDNEGRTPLHYAARDPNVYSFILKDGADETLLDQKGKSPAYYRLHPLELDTRHLRNVPDAPRVSGDLSGWDRASPTINVGGKRRTSSGEFSNNSQVTGKYDLRVVELSEGDLHVDDFDFAPEAQKPISQIQSREPSGQSMIMDMSEAKSKSNSRAASRVEEGYGSRAPSRATSNMEATKAESRTISRQSIRSGESRTISRINSRNDIDQNEKGLLPGESFAQGTYEEEMPIEDNIFETASEEKVQETTEEDMEGETLADQGPPLEVEQEEVEQEIPERPLSMRENENQDAMMEDDNGEVEVSEDVPANFDESVRETEGTNENESVDEVPDTQSKSPEVVEEADIFQTQAVEEGTTYDEQTDDITVIEGVGNENQEAALEIEQPVEPEIEPPVELEIEQEVELKIESEVEPEIGSEVEPEIESEVEPVVENEIEFENTLENELEEDIGNEVEVKNEEEEVDEVDAALKRGDMEALVDKILNGKGLELINRTTENVEVQEFLLNVPAYMAKISSIHNAASNGNLRDLQSLLDRKRLALARDQVGRGPLHKAVLNNHTTVARYLASTYPQSLRLLDTKGRSPLHFAATLSDSGSMYKYLVNLGADPNVKDVEGNTPGIYLRNRELLTHKELLDESESVMGMDNVPVQRWERPKTPAVSTLSTLENFYNTTLMKRESLWTKAWRRLTHQGESNFKELVRKYLDKDTFDLIKSRGMYDGGTLLDVVKFYPQFFIIAPGEDAYDVYQELFVPAIIDHNHLTEEFVAKTSVLGEILMPFQIPQVDIPSKFVTQVRIRVSRNIRPFPFVPQMKKGDLLRVSNLLKTVQLNWPCFNIEDLEKDVREELKLKCWMPEATKISRLWPKQRYFSLSHDGNVQVWMNAEDHFDVIVTSKYGKLYPMLETLNDVYMLFSQQFTFYENTQFGFLTVNPFRVGTGMKITFRIRLPTLMKEKAELIELCAEHNLAVNWKKNTMEREIEPDDWIELENNMTLGKSELDLALDIANSVNQLIKAEEQRARFLILAEKENNKK